MRHGRGVAVARAQVVRPMPGAGWLGLLTAVAIVLAAGLAHGQTAPAVPEGGAPKAETPGVPGTTSSPAVIKPPVVGTMPVIPPPSNAGTMPVIAPPGSPGGAATVPEKVVPK